MSYSETDTTTKVKKPSMFTVLFLNDDYTPMAFVIEILQKIFHLNLDEAASITMKIHKEGRASVGRYTFEIASHKASVVIDLALKNKFPLKASAEPI